MRTRQGARPAHPLRVRAPNATRAPGRDRGTYLYALFGTEPAGTYAEVRYRGTAGRGMGQEFVELGSPDAFRRLDHLIATRGQTNDVYIVSLHIILDRLLSVDNPRSH